MSIIFQIFLFLNPVLEESIYLIKILLYSVALIGKLRSLIRQATSKNAFSLHGMERQVIRYQIHNLPRIASINLEIKMLQVGNRINKPVLIELSNINGKMSFWDIFCGRAAQPRNVDGGRFCIDLELKNFPSLRDNCQKTNSHFSSKLRQTLKTFLWQWEILVYLKGLSNGEFFQCRVQVNAYYL